MGSIRDARRAGDHVAASRTASSTVVATPNASGSMVPTPTSRLCSSVLTPIARRETDGRADAASRAA